MSIHGKYIRRCIELAENGLGTTYPNPMVGAVAVHNDKIIGEGWHRKAGGPHAEVHAINSVKDKSLLSESTIYVSLEPCSHYGKTPPCSDLIIDSGIKNVIIGTIDPFAEVSGRGIEKLMNAGCKVAVGILDDECRELNKRFFTYHNKQRPYVILKWAESSDGYISPDKKNKKEPVWLSNPYSRQLVHKWRSEEQSILVGTNTIMDDNPKLNTRDWYGSSPVRVIIDRTLRTYPDHSVWDNSIKTIVLTESNRDTTSGSNIFIERIDFNASVPKQLLNVLYRHHIQSVIVEGGKKTLQAFIDENLFDEIRQFIGDSNMGAGTKAPDFNAELTSKTRILNDTLNIYKTHGKEYSF